MNMDEHFAEIVRRVVREELARVDMGRTEMLTAEDVARDLKVNKQKVYSLVREGELDAVRISQREMRFTREAVREFQLRKGIKAA